MSKVLGISMIGIALLWPWLSFGKTGKNDILCETNGGDGMGYLFIENRTNALSPDKITLPGRTEEQLASTAKTPVKLEMNVLIPHLLEITRTVESEPREDQLGFVLLKNRKTDGKVKWNLAPRRIKGPGPQRTFEHLPSWIFDVVAADGKTVTHQLAGQITASGDKQLKVCTPDQSGACDTVSGCFAVPHSLRLLYSDLIEGIERNKGPWECFLDPVMNSEAVKAELSKPGSISKEKTYEVGIKHRAFTGTEVKQCASWLKELRKKNYYTDWTQLNQTAQNPKIPPATAPARVARKDETRAPQNGGQPTGASPRDERGQPDPRNRAITRSRLEIPGAVRCFNALEKAVYASAGPEIPRMTYPDGWVAVPGKFGKDEGALIFSEKEPAACSFYSDQFLMLTPHGFFMEMLGDERAISDNAQKGKPALDLDGRANGYLADFLAARMAKIYQRLTPPPAANGASGENVGNFPERTLREAVPELGRLNSAGETPPRTGEMSLKTDPFEPGNPREARLRETNTALLEAVDRSFEASRAGNNEEEQMYVTRESLIASLRTCTKEIKGDERVRKIALDYLSKLEHSGGTAPAGAGPSGSSADSPR